MSGEVLIEIRHLQKVFGDHEVLSDINFTVSRGDVTCIIGPSGSGKSTLVQLIAGLYDAPAGSVKIFGHDIADYTAAQRNNMIGFAMQKSVLFSGTLRENLQWRQAKNK